MMSTLGGCSLFDSDDKNVIAVAEQYAEAVVKADVSDIADLSADADDLEEDLEAYIDKYSYNEDLSGIFDCIHEHMTYEIDQKSVESSKKHKEASADIVFNIIDYMDVYDIYNDCEDAEEFIDALEENAENTKEIRVTIQFELDKDDWKVVDEDYEAIYEVYNFYPGITNLGWIKLEPVDSDDFEDAVGEIFNRNSEYYGYYDMGEFSAIYYIDDDYSIDYYAFGDTSESLGMFDSYYDMYLEVASQYDDGAVYPFVSDDGGYILLNGDIHYDKNDSEYNYGGIYLTGNTMIMIITNRDDQDCRDKVDQFLDAIGYPKPM